jgi:hypothetical protein
MIKRDSEVLINQIRVNLPKAQNGGIRDMRFGFEEMRYGTCQDLARHERPKSTIEHNVRLYLEHELSAVRKSRALFRGGAGLPPPWIDC